MAEHKKAFELMELTNVGDGRAVELFETGLREILRDLNNEDKNPLDKRTLKIQIDFLPPEQTGGPIEVAVTGETKLAKPVLSRTYATRDRHGRMVQYRNMQDELPLVENVEPMAHNEEGADGAQS